MAGLPAAAWRAGQNFAWGWRFVFDIDRSRALLWLGATMAAGLAPLALLLAARLGLGRFSAEPGNAIEPSLAALAAVLVAILFLTYLLQAWVNWLRGTMENRVQEAIHQVLLDRINEQAPAFFDTGANQNLLHRARGDALAQPAALFQASGQLIQTALLFLGILIYLGLMSWVYPALLLAAALPAMVVFGLSAVYGHRSRRRDTVLQRMAATLMFLLTDARGIQELRQTHADSAFSQQHARLMRRLSRGAAQRGRRELLATLTAGLFLLLSVVTGLGWMLSQYEQGLIVGSSLIVGVVVFVLAHRLAGAMLEALLRLYRGGLFLDDLRCILDLPPAQAPRQPLVSAPGRCERGIVIRQLRFRYPGAREPTLTDLNLEIQAGKITLLTGPNGCGKSTLLRLIAGLYPPQAGEILIDGIPLQSIAIDSWRERLGFMFQDFAHYPGSLLDNVSLKRAAATRHWGLSRRFGQLDPLLADLPQAEHTRLGRAFGGVELSGGQWQRIALARLVATDAPILLLDEPTSSLDPEARERFWDELEKLRSGRLILVASHDAPQLTGRGFEQLVLDAPPDRPAPLASAS